MSSMMSETSGSPSPPAAPARRGPSARRRGDLRHGHAEGVADLVAIRPPISYCMPRGGLEPLDQRAPFEVGEHAVELVGDLLELGQQVLLLGDRLVHLLLGGAATALPRLALPASVVTGSVSRGWLGVLLGGACWPSSLSGGCCDDSRSTTCGTPVLAFLASSASSRLRLRPACRGPCPAIGVLSRWACRAPAGACAACLSRSATEGMRLPAMSLRIWSISAHFSRWPTPNSGFRMACWTRSSPVTTRSDSRRPLARSAAAWFSIRRRVSGRSSSSAARARSCLLVS